MTPATASVAGPAGRSLPCILVVDDDPLSRSLQARLVGLLGFGVRVATSATEALDIALDQGIDAVLLDLGMPEVDGFTLLARLRVLERQRQTSPLPVIAVTGYAASLDRVRCLMAGFNDHLSKPVEVGALRATLQRHLPATARAPLPNSDALRVEAAARRLAQVKPDDARFAPTLLETFAMRSGQLIEEITQAQAQDRGSGLLHAAQALQKSAEFMGATSLAALCERLRAAADSRDRTRVDALVRDLADEHQSVLGVLLLGARDAAGPR